MKSLRFLLVLVGGGLAVSLTSGAAWAFSSAPPAGLTGSPASGGASCIGCHNPGVGGSVQILNFPAQYALSTNYDLTVKIADPSQVGAGFQISVEKAGAMHVGTLTVIDATHTQLNSTNWVNHTLAGVTNSITNWVASGNMASFTVRWTSPATDQGPITAYAVGNAINNAGGNAGDEVYLTNVTSNFVGPVPTISQWGMVVLALLVVCAGTLTLRRRCAA